MTVNPQKHPRVDDPIVDPPSDLREMANRTQFIISGELVRAKWLELERLAAGSGIKPGKAEAQKAFLDPLFLGCKGITVQHPVTAIFRGNETCFPGFELYCEVNEERRPILEALEVQTSVEAFVEAGYIAMHLRTKYLRWHAMYGADYAFFFDQESSWVHGNAASWVDLAEIRKKIDRPVGMRVSKRREMYYISCLVAYSNGKLIDRVIRVDAGRIVELPSPDVISPKQVHRIF